MGNVDITWVTQYGILGIIVFLLYRDVVSPIFKNYTNKPIELSSSDKSIRKIESTIIEIQQSIYKVEKEVGFIKTNLSELHNSISKNEGTQKLNHTTLGQSVERIEATLNRLNERLVVLSTILGGSRVNDM